jgi:hypothetical protein
MVLWNSQGPTGRERAIESLIDREPHGNYYRAARVVVRIVIFYPRISHVPESS